MHPDTADYISRLMDLVDEGRLPESAIPRLFYSGHEVVCGFVPDARKYKCIECNAEWIITDEQAKELTILSCPFCHSVGSDTIDNVIFDITERPPPRWRCRTCKHEWESDDGHDCPSCGEHRN